MSTHSYAGEKDNFLMKRYSTVLLVLFLIPIEISVTLRATFNFTFIPATMTLYLLISYRAFAVCFLAELFSNN